MRRFNLKFTGFIGILAALALFIGCGGSDGFLDEANGRFTYSLTLDDGGQSEDEIDILQSNCDGNATSSDDDEDFFATIGTITVSVASDAPGLTLKDYSIRYIPVASPTGNNTIENPPALMSPGSQGMSWYIGSGETKSTSIPVLSIDTKEEYRDDVGFIQDPISLVVTVWPELDNAYYTIRITLNFEDDNQQDKTIEIEETVWLGPWDNC